jgi:DNA invertase Pin-like site-specific DNA recombinase
MRVKDEGYSLANIPIFIDNGVNGATLDRPAFNQMNEVIRQGGVEAVYVMNHDRIGRDIIDVHNWLQEMERMGIKVTGEDGETLNFISHERLMQMIEEVQQWVARL